MDNMEIKKNILLVANVRVLEDEALFSKAYSSVSAYRRQDVDRHRFKNNKCLSLATELLLKHGYCILGEDIDLEKIVYGGKPYIDGYHFNFSHSGDYAICAISDDEVGCDIERIAEANLKIAKRFYHENEYKRLASLSDEAEQRKIFYYYWTAKEAFVKNIGTGIKTPLSSFEILFDDGVRINQNISEGEYRFKLYSMEDYAICVCSLNDKETEIVSVDLREII